MTEEKILKAFSTIQRALGIIEGVACGVPKDAGTSLIDAVEMIDGALREIGGTDNA